MINRRSLLLGTAATVVAPLPSPVKAFAMGGVIRGRATMIVDGKPLRLLGERGAEAILPLSRDRDGNLSSTVRKHRTIV